MQKEDVIIELLKNISAQVSDIDVGLEKDRPNFQNTNIRLAAMESQLEELRKAINQNAERVKNKVADVVEGVVGATDYLTTEIQKKKMVVLKEKKKWWRKILG